MVRFRVMLVGAVAILVLAGCTPTPAPSTTRTTTPSATPAAMTLACDDLADHAQIAASLGGSADTADPTVTRIATLAQSVYYASSVRAAGGLTCDWTGAGDATTRPDLEIDVLPGAASQWTAMLFGDGPSDQTHTFGSHTVTADFGDPGYGVTAPIGSSWVFIQYTEPGLAESTSAADGDAVLAKASPVIQSILDRVAAATPAQLAWPTAAPAQPVTADTCAQYLPLDKLDALVGASLTYAARPQPLSDTSSIGDVAAARAGWVDCVAGAHPDEEAVLFDVARGAAPMLGGLRNGIPSVGLPAFQPLTLTGQAGGDWAIGRDCQSGGAACDVIFQRGRDIIETQSSKPDSTALAEAILTAAS